MNEVTDVKVGLLRRIVRHIEYTDIFGLMFLIAGLTVLAGLEPEMESYIKLFGLNLVFTSMGFAAVLFTIGNLKRRNELL